MIFTNSNLFIVCTESISNKSIQKNKRCNVRISARKKKRKLQFFIGLLQTLAQTSAEYNIVAVCTYEIGLHYKLKIIEYIRDDIIE